MLESDTIVQRLRAALRLERYSPRTERAYVGWIRRFIAFHDGRDPIELGSDAVRAFLSALAEQNVSASTQNQALAAILFLHPRIYAVPLGMIGDFLHARRPHRLPVVLTRDEVAALLRHLEGSTLLMASLLYGAGLRLLECATLRVKDICLPLASAAQREYVGRTSLACPSSSRTRRPASVTGFLGTQPNQWCLSSLMKV